MKLNVIKLAPRTERKMAKNIQKPEDQGFTKVLRVAAYEAEKLLINPDIECSSSSDSSDNDNDDNHQHHDRKNR